MTPPARPSDAPTWPILAAAVVLGAGVGLVFPLLAEIQDLHGFSTAGLGLISGMAFLAAVASGMLLAGFADRGHARLLLVAGLVASGLALLWFAAADQLWEFVVARGVEGLGAGIYFPAARKLVSAGDPLRAGRRLGTLTSAEVGGLLLGPVIGATLTATAGLDAPFLVLGVLTLVAAVLLRLVHLPEPPPAEEPRAPWRSVALLRRPPVAGAALLSLALFLPVGVYDALWARYLEDRGAGTVFIGLSLSFYAVPVILLAPWGGRLADRLGPVRAATGALLVIIPLTVTYGVLTWPLAIAVVALLEGVPQAVANPAVQTAMLRACRADEAAAGQGVATSMNQVGAALAALAAPAAYQVVGPVAVFGGAATLMALLFAAGLALHRRGGTRPAALDPAALDPARPAVTRSPVPPAPGSA